jgi:hypothetical protein
MNLDALLGEATFPIELGADLSGIVQQPHGHLLLSQVREAVVVGIAGGNKGLLAVEYGGIGRIAVVSGFDIAGFPIDDGAAPQEGMRFGIELGVVEVRNFRLVEVKLNQGKGYWLFQQAASSLLLANKQFMQLEQGRMVDVESVGQAFADVAGLAELNQVCLGQVVGCYDEPGIRTLSHLQYTCANYLEGIGCQVSGAGCQVSGDKARLEPDTRNPIPSTPNPVPDTQSPHPWCLSPPFPARMTLLRDIVPG